jgi:hypothetical protein
MTLDTSHEKENGRVHAIEKVQAGLPVLSILQVYCR